MAAPTSYTLSYDFTGFQTVNPTIPLPADKIEIEFNNISTTTEQLIDNLALIQRADGALNNSVVTYEALSNTVKALLGSAIVPRGVWLTATAYAILDLVEEDGSSYICASAHTSGVFATDVAAGRWVLWAAGTGGSVIINNDNWSGADLSVSNGGTGRSSNTAYAVICGGTTTTNAQQSVASVGTVGQVLMSNGADALPTFETFLPALGAANTVPQVNASGTALEYEKIKSANITIDGNIDMGFAYKLENLSNPFNNQDAATKSYVDGDGKGIAQRISNADTTLALSDAGGHVYRAQADTTARTWTVPANASVAFPIGRAITLINDGASGNISIPITTDTMVLAGSGTTGTRTLAPGGVATLIKVTSTRWIISGVGLT